MKSLGIDHFRCFSDLKVEFSPGINLLIGDNGCGKTSLLMACKYALSSFFAGYSDENTNWMGFTSDDFQEQVVEGVIQPHQPIVLSFSMDDIFSQEEYKAYLAGRYYLKKQSEKSARMLVEGIKDYKAFTASLMSSLFVENQQTVGLPLFACFSTEDIHANRKINASKFSQYHHKNSFAYYECMEGSGFYRYWIKRLLVLAEGKKKTHEMETVHGAVVKALGPNGCDIIRDMEVRYIQGEVYFIFTDGREVASPHLPDGYKRMVNIVMDLAFRCSLLNHAIYGDKCCERTKGTVLIDEIDMHLHPSLQGKVLKGLRKAFPKLQFIVSTHAPMVMSGVDNNDMDTVFQMSYAKESGHSIRRVDTYGLDMTTISEYVLKTGSRASEVEALLGQLFTCIDEENYEEASKLRDQMRGSFGDRLPELAKATALIDFMR